MNLAPEQGLDEALVLGEGHGVVHVFLDTGVFLEIAVDEGLRLAARYPQVARKPEARNTVDHPEIDRLGAPSCLRCHLVERHVEHLRRGGGVDVFAIPEGLPHAFDPGHIGEDAQLDLAIVERDQSSALGRHESLADAAALFAAHRDVLQVRIGRGEAAGIGPGLQVGGMHPAGLGVDMGLERVGIGRFQLRELAPVEHAGGQVMALGGEVFEHVGAGGIGAGLALLAALQPHLVKQDFAKLLGAANIEALARQLMNLRLEPGHLLGEGVGHAAERVAVDLHAVHFHLGQHRHQRPLQRFVNGRHLRAMELRLERLPQPQGYVCVFGGVFHRLVDGHAIEGDRRLAAAEERLDRDRLMVKVAVR